MWYEKKPASVKNLKDLTESNNDKYGNFDYTQDSRSLDFDFEVALIKAVGDITGQRILVCGSNSGYEIKILKKHFKESIFTAVDVSTHALSKLINELPDTEIIHADMEALPFKEKDFDMYLNCRAIHSTNVDMEKAINEAVRVTKGQIVLTVSNGYRIDDGIVNGMYDYETQNIEEEKPKEVTKFLKSVLISLGYHVEVEASKAEIFLKAVPQ